MYLTDTQLLDRLNDFEFETEHADLQFDPDAQVGPCSIDLRLSLLYWTQKPRRSRRPRVIDLDRAYLQELSPHRGWSRHAVNPGDRITLRPGEMVLARVSERFRMPPDCAGAVEGRSSYARLGLTVHATGGFINPGWQGHMPLTLHNQSGSTLRIPVGTPLCQLMVIQLADAPDRDYSNRDDRKYLNDLGGPSYWWRDRIMREMRDNLPVDIGDRLIDELDALVGGAEEDLLERLEAFIIGTKQRQYGSAEEMLDEFARVEERSRKRWHSAQFAREWAWTALVAVLLTLLAATVPHWVIGLSAVVAGLSVVLALVSASREPGTFLTPAVLGELRRKRDSAASGGVSG